MLVVHWLLSYKLLATGNETIFREGIQSTMGHVVIEKKKRLPKNSLKKNVGSVI